MWKNYIIIAVRNIIRKKFHSFVNILGLAIGITLCLLIALFVLDELSYDKFHKKSDRIYRVIGDFSIGGKVGEFPISPAPMGPTLKNTFPEVKEFCRFRTRGNRVVNYEQESFKVKDVIFADSTFFDLFSFNLIKGNPATCLARKQSVVLSQSLAEKIFGGEDPLGKIVATSNNEKYEVSGVIEDMPQNSHLHFDMIFSMVSLDRRATQQWMSNNYFTYLEMQGHTDIEAFEEKLNKLYSEKMAPQIEENLGKSLDEFQEEGNYMRAFLQPMTDVHLYSDFDLEITDRRGDIKYVYIFSAIALFILVIACVNFMNLATAKSEHRAREVGVRKVLGAERKHVIVQFLAEAVLIAVLALLFALLLVELTLPYFNNFTGKSLSILDIGEFGIVPVLILLPIVVGIFAGSYPAFYLSAFHPISIIRGKLSGGKQTTYTRNGLVIFQFTLSFIMVVGTIVVYQQLQMLQNKDLGYNKDNLLVLQDAYQLGDQIESFRNEMLNEPEFKRATITSYLTAGESDYNNHLVFPDGDPSSERSIPCQLFRVDENFVETYGMNVRKGRDFEEDFADSNTMVINQRAAEKFGFEEPLGKTLGMFGNGSGGVKEYKIVGVVEDFHFRDLKLEIDPLVMIKERSDNSILFRLKGDATERAIAKLGEEWNTFTNGKPFIYSFINERLRNSLSAERKLSTIFVIFCVLAIFIASLGLFGLASYTAEQRTKEIGIRKILGAEVEQILMLLSRDFSKLILVAFLVGAPVAYFAMNKWLQSFAYRIEIHWYIFILTGLFLLVVALATVSYQSLKAARMDPVKALRQE